MKRVIVAGGAGFFGKAALELLGQRGINAVAASRRSGELRLDVQNHASLRAALRAGDVVLDTVGPFQDRSTALIEVAIEIGCAVVDISDSLDYAQKVYALRDAMASSMSCVLSSCSSVSVVTSMLVAASGVEVPVRVSGFLIPSARYSASAATADSLMRSIGRPIQVWRDGELQTTRGWLDDRRATLPEPIGAVHGRVFESADSFWLPQIWPSLRTVEMYVDTRVFGLNRLLALAAHVPLLRCLMARYQTLGHRIARRLGRCDGCLAVEVEAADSRSSTAAIYCRDHGYRLAVLPAVLAAAELATNGPWKTGLIPPQRQLPAEALRSVLEAEVPSRTLFHPSC